MTKHSEQEREDTFLRLVLSQEDAAIYRRYISLSPNELDKVNIPNLRDKMWEMTSRLVFAGLLDKDCKVPYEKVEPDFYFGQHTVWSKRGYEYNYVYSEFLILRDGHTVCYDTISWHEAINHVLKYNNLEPWKMDDALMIVRFTTTEVWYEVHPRCKIPAVLDAFKDHLRDIFKNVIALGSCEDPDGGPFKLPMRQSINYKIPCRDGFKISLPSDDGKYMWMGIEVMPLTCSGKGILAVEEKRAIRDTSRTH